MSSRKKVGRATIPKNTVISSIDLAHIACYRSQDIDRCTWGAAWRSRGVLIKKILPSSEALFKRSALQAKRSSSIALFKRSALYFANDDTTSILFFCSRNFIWMPAVRRLLYGRSRNRACLSWWSRKHCTISIRGSFKLYRKIFVYDQRRVRYQRTCRRPMLFLSRRMHHLSGSPRPVPNVSILVRKLTFLEKMATSIKGMPGNRFQETLLQGTNP